jgi:Cys-tRNA(Pro)/Cys-tRNA(Cys) deacylase
VSEDASARLERLRLRLGTRVRVVRHADLGREIRSALDFARAVGCAPGQVAKTLLLGAVQVPAEDDPAADRRYAGMVLALPDRVDLGAVAAAFGAAGVQLASRDELRRVLGTAPGAVSPFGMGRIPLTIDDKLMGLPAVYVSGGIPGIDIEIAPADLVEVTRARVGRVSAPS